MCAGAAISCPCISITSRWQAYNSCRYESNIEKLQRGRQQLWRICAEQLSGPSSSWPAQLCSFHHALEALAAGELRVYACIAPVAEFGSL